MLYNRHSVQILTSIPMLFVLVFKLNVASMENVVVFIELQQVQFRFNYLSCLNAFRQQTMENNERRERQAGKQAWEKGDQGNKTASSQCCVVNHSDYIILDATKIQQIWKMPDAVKFFMFHIDTGIVCCIFPLVNRYQKQCKPSDDYLRIANIFILIICTENIERDGCQCNSIFVFVE